MNDCQSKLGFERSYALQYPFMGATEVSDKKKLSHVTRYYKFCHWHLWRLSTNSSHLWKFGTNFSHSVSILHICEHLVPILPICENWIPFLHRCEELVPILHICENWVPILLIWGKIEPVLRRWHECVPILQLKMRKMWNLSTDVRSPKSSKLTIRKFHIFQKLRFGTNSSHGVKFAKCEICGST